MQSHYGQQQARVSHDFDQGVGNTRNTLSTATTTYRSAVSPRVTNLTRSRPTGLHTAGASTRMVHSYLSTGGSGGFGPGLASLVQFSGVPLRGGSSWANTAVVGINTTRQRDKRDLENLNDKFAQYVEKVRFLEAHNRKLGMELDVLRSRSGQGSSRIKEMYDIEMAEANKLIDDTKRDAASAKVKAQQLEQEARRQEARMKDISGLRETDRREIDLIQQKVAENEAQIALFRRRMADLEDESRRYKAESQRLSSEIARLQNEIQNELFLKASHEVDKVALEDDLANLQHLHEADLAELRSQSVSNDLDPSQFFRNELAESIREIRQDYENAMDNRRNDLQNRYYLSVNESIIRTQSPSGNPLFNVQQQRQVERLRTELLQAQNQNGHLRAKIQQMQNSMADLQRKIKDLLDGDAQAKARAERDIDEARRHLDRVQQDYAKVIEFKTSLEKEIETYRKYLEGPDGLRGCVERIVQNAEQQALDRPSGNPNPKSIRGSGTSTTTTVSRTYINTTGSNGGYGGPNTGPPTSILSNQPPAAQDVYQTLSNTYRNVVTRDSTNQSTSFRNSAIRDETSYSATLRDNSSYTTPVRDSTGRDYIPRDNSNRNSLVRDSSNRDSLVRDGSNRDSLVRDSSSTGRDSLRREDSAHDNRQSEIYDEISDDV